MLRNHSVFKFRTEYIRRHFDDLCRVIIVFCKNQRLRNVLPSSFTVGIQLVIDGFFVCLQHLPDLVGIHHGTIEYLWRVIHSLSGLIDGFLASPPGGFYDFRSGFDSAAVFGYPGDDSVHTFRNIDAVHNRIVIGVVGNFIVVEKR